MNIRFVSMIGFNSKRLVIQVSSYPCFIDIFDPTHLSTDCVNSLLESPAEGLNKPQLHRKPLSKQSVLNYKHEESKHSKQAVIFTKHFN